MASRIQGITVEIGGDVGPLQKALKEVNSTISTTQSQLKDVDKLLKLDPNNVELLRQKQEGLSTAIDATKDKLQTLKEANDNVTVNNDKYDAWKAKYAPIQGEITKTEDALAKLQKEAKECDEKIKAGVKAEAKYNVLQGEIQETEKKYETLKEKAQEADKQLAEGKISKEKYDEIQAELKETEDKLGSLKTESQECERVMNEGKLAKDKYDTLQQEISETETKLESLKQKAKDVTDEFGNPISTEQYDALQREIIATEEELKRLAAEAANTNTALTKIGDVGRSLEDLGGKISSVGQNLTTHISLPLAAVGTAGVKSFAEVDKTMQLANKTMGNTTEEAEMLNAAMKEAAANSTFGMSDAATAVLNFARAGLDAEQAAAALAPAMNLAAGEGGNLDTVSGGLVATINGFHGSFEDAGHYADVFASACNNSALDVDSLSHAMSVAAPIFSAAGYSVEDAALYMGVMANNGIDADKAANSLKTGLARLVSPAKEGAEKMAELGISVTNADGSMKDSVTIQKELHEAFSKLSESEQIAAASAIFGKNQMAPWLALINTAPEDVGDLDASLRNCAGTTDEMAEAMMSGFGGSLEKLKSSIDVLVTSIGEALAPTIQKVTDFIQKLVDKFNALTPAQQQTIVKVGLLVAALGPALVVFGKLTTGIGKGLQAVEKMGKGILTFVNEAKAGVGAGGKFASAIASINPATVAVVGGIAVLSAAFVHLWQNNEEFRNKVIGIWESVKEKFSAVAQKITDLINSLGFNFEDLGQAISAAWDWICNALEPIITAVLQSVGDAIESIIDVVGGVIQVIVGLIKGFKDGDWTAFLQGISDIFTGVINALLIPFRALFSLFGIDLEKFDGDWGALWDGIKSVFETIWNAIKSFFEGIWNGIQTVVTTVVSAISGAISTAWNTVKGVFESVWNAIKSFFEGIWNGLSGTVTTVSSAISTGISTAWNTIKGVFETVWNAIKGFFEGIWNGLQTTVTTVTTAVSTAVSTAWNTVKTTFETVWNGIKGFFDGVWTGLQNTVTTVTSAISTGISTAWETVKTTFETAWNGISTFFTGVWDGLKNTVTTVMDGIKSGVETGWNAVKTTTETVWNNTKTFVSTTWENIKTSVGGFVDSIKEKVSTVWNSIKDTVGKVMDGLKQGISDKWNAAKNAVSTTVDNIKTGVSDKWKSIKDKVGSTVDNIKSALSDKWGAAKDKVNSVVDAIKSNVTDKWNSIKDKVGSVVDTLKSNVSSKWESIKSDLTSKLTNITSTMTSKWESIKSGVTSKIDSMKSAITSKFQSIQSDISSKVGSITSAMSTGFTNAYNTVTSKFESIKTKIGNIMNSAKSVVQSAINGIKSVFNFSWSLPKLKLPHFTISGKFSLNPPSVPKFSIQWYKKAMENPIMLNGATIFGSMGDKLLGGGEAGSEVVAGTEKLMAMIQQAVKNAVDMSRYSDMVSGTMANAMNNLTPNAADDSTGRTIISMLSRYLPYLPEVANMQMVTDTGALVAQIAPQMDKELGNISRRARRQ